jgi:hypothetical protein
MTRAAVLRGEHHAEGEAARWEDRLDEQDGERGRMREIREQHARISSLTAWQREVDAGVSQGKRRVAMVQRATLDASRTIGRSAASVRTGSGRE